MELTTWCNRTLARLRTGLNKRQSNLSARVRSTMLGGPIGVITGVLRDFERKHLSLIAAGLAYNFLMSMLPALLLLTSLAAYLPLQGGAYGLLSFLSPVVPQQSMGLMVQLLNTIGSHRAGLLSFASVTTLWITSIATKSIIAALDIVYEVREPRRVWTNKVLAVGLSLAVGILLLMAVLLTLVGPLIERLLSGVGPVQSIWLQIWPFAHWGLAALFTFAAIELLYLFAANIPASPRRTTLGALVATVGLLALAWGLSWYFSNFGEMKMGRLVEALATPIAVAVWLLWSANVVLLGAEINLNTFKKSSSV